MASLAGRGVAPRVVGDQIGRLTFTTDLAEAIRHLLDVSAPFGLYNVTGGGEPHSWADIARAVYRLTGHDPAAVTSVTTEEYFADQAGGVTGADLVADIHLTQAQAPADGRANLAELQVEFGLVDTGLVGFQGATVLVDQRLLGVQGLPGNGVLGQQVLVALQVNLGIAQLRLVLLQGAFGFVQGGAVTARINHCQ